MGGSTGAMRRGAQDAHLLTSGGNLCALFRKAAMPAIADDDIVVGARRCPASCTRTSDASA